MSKISQWYFDITHTQNKEPEPKFYSDYETEESKMYYSESKNYDVKDNDLKDNGYDDIPF